MHRIRVLKRLRFFQHILGWLLVCCVYIPPFRVIGWLLVWSYGGGGSPPSPSKFCSLIFKSDGCLLRFISYSVKHEMENIDQQQFTFKVFKMQKTYNFLGMFSIFFLFTRSPFLSEKNSKNLKLLGSLIACFLHLEHSISDLSLV